MSIAVDWYITDIGYKRSIILEEGFKSLKQVVGGNLGNKGKTSGRTAEPWQKIRTNKKENSHNFACKLLTINHMTFLVQCGINQHSYIFQRLTKSHKPKRQKQFVADLSQMH